MRIHYVQEIVKAGQANRARDIFKGPEFIDDIELLVDGAVIH